MGHQERPATKIEDGANVEEEDQKPPIKEPRTTTTTTTTTTVTTTTTATVPAPAIGKIAAAKVGPRQGPAQDVHQGGERAREAREDQVGHGGWVPSDESLREVCHHGEQRQGALGGSAAGAASPEPLGAPPSPRGEGVEAARGVPELLPRGGSGGGPRGLPAGGVQPQPIGDADQGVQSREAPQVPGQGTLRQGAHSFPSADTPACRAGGAAEGGGGQAPLLSPRGERRGVDLVPGGARGEVIGSGDPSAIQAAGESLGEGGHGAFDAEGGGHGGGQQLVFHAFKPVPVFLPLNPRAKVWTRQGRSGAANPRVWRRTRENWREWTVHKEFYLNPLGLPPSKGAGKEEPAGEAVPPPPPQHAEATYSTLCTYVSQPPII